ncbi:hypothetical protein BPAE_0036g00640 [Botrytis paeoniae]|uniref:Uncharacterized protein n=1 Tax=Botrytis paeoniae TaxID=278948 RepID=A0A4Z1G0U6_9HELO|nr:hypothetical protein BPAE_0036g00640 [Botrytis paeoniae]
MFWGRERVDGIGWEMGNGNGMEMRVEIQSNLKAIARLPANKRPQRKSFPKRMAAATLMCQVGLDWVGLGFSWLGVWLAWCLLSMCLTKK